MEYCLDKERDGMMAVTYSVYVRTKQVDTTDVTNGL